MTLCPNCNGLLNVLGCQACGWKHGDPHTRNQDVFPFKIGADYGIARPADMLHPDFARAVRREIPAVLSPHAQAVTGAESKAGDAVIEQPPAPAEPPNVDAPSAVDESPAEPPILTSPEADLAAMPTSNKVQ